MGGRGSRPGPRFIFQNGIPLSCLHMNSILGLLLDICRVEGDYTSHSFRIGAATTAARAGLPDHLVLVVGQVMRIYCVKPVTTEKIYHNSFIAFPVGISHFDNFNCFQIILPESKLTALINSFLNGA